MKIRLVGLLAVGATLLSSYAGSAAAAEPTYDIKPAQLARGADVRVPHVEGNSIVDGDRRIGFASHPFLLGMSDTAYIVWLNDGRFLRVEASGARMVIRRGTYPATLSADGSMLATTTGNRDVTRVTITDTFTGDVIRSRRFSAGWAGVLDFVGNRVVLSAFTSDDHRTWLWNLRLRSVRNIMNRPGYLADLTNDRLAVYTKDPYQGGCTRLVRFSDPTQTLWRSCTDRITALSPTAVRMATIHILSDGIGPNQVTLRGARGGALASYTAEWFGAIFFESDRALIMQANGTKKSALVRCTPGGCVRASELSDVETF